MAVLFRNFLANLDASDNNLSSKLLKSQNPLQKVTFPSGQLCRSGRGKAGPYPAEAPGPGFSFKAKVSILSAASSGRYPGKGSWTARTQEPYMLHISFDLVMYERKA